MKSVNYYAIFTIIKFKIKDFLKDYHYSILAPLINNLLFVIIFSTIDHYYSINMSGKPFIEFLIPGLILIVAAQESFDNSSATLVHMKLVGSLNDFLSAPISRIEIFISLLLSSLIHGLFLGIANLLILSFFIEFEIIRLIFFLFYLSITIIFFSSIGCITGFISYNWDTQSVISSFFVTPINFLSGTFFSIEVLPDNLKYIFLYNPYYYVIDSFRSTFYLNFKLDLIINLYILLFLLFIILITSLIFTKGYRVIK